MLYPSSTDLTAELMLAALREHAKVVREHAARDEPNAIPVEDTNPMNLERMSVRCSCEHCKLERLRHAPCEYGGKHTVAECRCDPHELQ